MPASIKTNLSTFTIIKIIIIINFNNHLFCKSKILFNFCFTSISFLIILVKAY